MTKRDNSDMNLLNAFARKKNRVNQSSGSDRCSTKVVLSKFNKIKKNSKYEESSTDDDAQSQQNSNDGEVKLNIYSKLFS